MKERTYKEWINLFITVNLGLFSLLMLLVPAYPWWLFAILTFLSGYIGPHFTGGGSGKSRSSNRSRF
jgi:hypothetical protein